MPVLSGTIAAIGAKSAVNAGIFTISIVNTLVNAATSTINSERSRKQQEQLAEENRKLTKEMEEVRQNFTVSQNEENARRQKELSLLNHNLRVEEQKINFENVCRQAEWNAFMSHWPLVNLPSVIRQEQILPDNTVSLRVIFSKSNDQNFSQAVYPQVEQGLREFVDLYHNVFDSHNIIFYHNAFVSNTSGGAVDANIHHALKELPVIIIDTNVLMDEIAVSLTMWGLGSSRQEHFTVFKIPYHAQKNLDYYREISIKLLAYLKFVLGYAYDAYNLIEYNRMPLLPEVAQYELAAGSSGCILNAEELQPLLADKYIEIYSSAIGPRNADNRTPSYALFPVNAKATILHELRLHYAEAVSSCISGTEYVRYLDESLDAWVSLRTSLPAGIFLAELVDSFHSGSNNALKYFSSSDVDYFNRLGHAYTQSPETSEYHQAFAEITGHLQIYADIIQAPDQKNTAKHSNGKLIKF